MEKTTEILNGILKTYKIKKNQLALALDVSPQFITKIFNDERKLSLKNADVIIEYFNLKEEDATELKKSIVFSKSDDNMKKWVMGLEEDAYKFQTISKESDINDIINLISKVKNKETRREILSFILFKLEEEKSDIK